MRSMECTQNFVAGEMRAILQRSLRDSFGTSSLKRFAWLTGRA